MRRLRRGCLRIGPDEAADIGQGENARALVDVDDAGLDRRDRRARLGVGEAHILVGAKAPSIDRQLGKPHLGAGVGEGCRQSRGLELAENALNVIVAGADREVGDVRRGRRVEGAESKAEIAGRPAGRSDDVGRKAPQLIKHQGGLLVPVGIELNAALLGDDAAEVF